MLKSAVVMFALSASLLVPWQNRGEVLNLCDAQNTRQIVCCENMRRVSTYFEVHSAQQGNYPMCTVTKHKTSYCANCYAIFEQVVIGTYEHQHPEVF